MQSLVNGMHRRYMLQNTSLRDGINNFERLLTLAHENSRIFDNFELYVFKEKFLIIKGN